MASARVAIRGAGWDRLARLREMMDVVASIRELDDPFGSPDEFRKLVDLVIRLASVFGVDAAWLDRWEKVLTDDDLVHVVLAVVHYVVDAMDKGRNSVQTAVGAVVVDAARYGDWLPPVVELLRIVRQLRGGR